ncbi:MAG TPA: tyrosine-type recombinase/integrase [Pirellulales bacterium]|nr:tyrosine-type recombinase/integrase [Pirellulales bacterium]
MYVTPEHFTAIYQAAGNAIMSGRAPGEDQEFQPVRFLMARKPSQPDEVFHDIQKATGVKLAGERGHYGFHDLRRAFATMNADKLTADTLQALMQHRAYSTTQRYINMARQLDSAVANLYTPTLGVSAG